MTNPLIVAAFVGMVCVEVVVCTCLIPVSMVEIATQKKLGSYDIVKAVHEFTIYVGTSD